MTPSPSPSSSVATIMRRCLALMLISMTLWMGGCAQTTRPNIVLILADDLGYSDLGCFGSEINTPNLDRLAAHGLRMTQFYNTGRCCPSRASLLTGLYPHQAGVGGLSADHGLPGYRGFLSDRSVTMAEVLRDHGYQTYLAGKWHLRGANPNCTPTQRGFDEFYGLFQAYGSFFKPELYKRLPEGRATKPYKKPAFYATDAITDHAIDFTQQSIQKNNPFFLYLSYNAPHFPLQAPKDDIERYAKAYEKGWDAIRTARHRRMLQLGILRSGERLSLRGPVPLEVGRNKNSPYAGKQNPAWDSLPNDRRKDLARRMATYAAMVDRMDQNIGRFLNHLKSKGAYENTLVVFCSDNGACAEWDPHGFDNNPYPQNKLYAGDDLDQIGQEGTFHSYGTGWANACNTPWRLYKHYNHEGGISTPTIVSWPSHLARAGQIDRTPAHLIDLMPTVLNLAQAQYPHRRKGLKIPPMEGRDLLPQWQGRTLSKRPIYFEHEGNRAVRLGKWKLVWSDFEKTWRLYDIDTDRTETQDQSNDQPEMKQKLIQMWGQWADRCQVKRHRVQKKNAVVPKLFYQP